MPKSSHILICANDVYHAIFHYGLTTYRFVYVHRRLKVWEGRWLPKISRVSLASQLKVNSKEQSMFALDVEIIDPRKHFLLPLYGICCRGSSHD